MAFDSWVRRARRRRLPAFQPGLHAPRRAGPAAREGRPHAHPLHRSSAKAAGRGWTRSPRSAPTSWGWTGPSTWAARGAGGRRVARPGQSRPPNVLFAPDEVVAREAWPCLTVSAGRSAPTAAGRPPVFTSAHASAAHRSAGVATLVEAVHSLPDDCARLSDGGRRRAAPPARPYGVSEYSGLTYPKKMLGAAAVPRPCQPAGPRRYVRSH